MLEVTGLSFAHRGGPEILRAIGFRAQPGTLTSVVGPNGSGKSTLIKCLAGLWRPQAGRITIGGRLRSDYSRNELARTVGWLPQSTTATFPITVLQSVMLGRHPYREVLSRKDNQLIAIQALQRLGLLDLTERNLSTLSGGQAQLAGLARVIAQQPAVLLLDEPTAAMDMHHVLRCVELIRDVATSDGRCVLMAIHDLSVALRFSDAVVMLDKGRVVGSGQPEAVITPSALRQHYRVQASVTEIDGTPLVLPHRPLSDETVS